MTERQRRRGDDDGAVMLLVAITMTVFIVLLALVIDIGMLRVDRRTDRLAADASASAGVADLDPFVGGDAAAACSATWNYLLLNLPADGFTAVPPNCLAFSGVCNPSAARSVTASIGPYDFDIVQPVPDGHSFMAGQALNPDVDGGACQRLGVGIVRERDFSFASLIGMSSSETEVSAVARIGVGLGAGELVPLLLLEPIACDAIYTSGQGRITISYFGETPGIIIVDSDASKTSQPNSCSNFWSIDSKGNQKGWIRAIPVPGQGISSVILSYALSGAPGANPAAAYDPSDLTDQLYYPDDISDPLEPAVSYFRMFPRPFPTSRRITRAPIDWRYNCKTGYPEYDLDTPGSGGVPVADCPEAATRLPHIDILRAQFGGAASIGIPPAGYAQWTTTHDCSYQPADPDVIATGDWWIDCPGGLTIKNNVTFSGGSIIADGPIEVGGGSLTINAGAPADEIVYLRSGRLYKVAQAALSMEQTFVYLADGWIDFGGGDGALTWTAPIGGTTNVAAGRFEDLALWSESRLVHKLGGQAGNQLEGTLFTPNADPFVLTGQSGQFQTAAQFLTRRLEVKGQGEVAMHPDPDRITLIPVRDLRLVR